MELETISSNIPLKFYLNVLGPNQYFVFASFLLLVEQFKGFEYTIEDQFTVKITKIKEKAMLLGDDDDDDSYKIQPSFSVQLLKNPEDSDLYVLNFKRLQGDVFSFFECYRSLYEAHYETKFPEVE